MNFIEDDNNNNSNEKEINISKENNSFLIKSIEETEFSLTELIKNKILILINLNSNNNINSYVKIKSKSIFTIFNLFTDFKNGENIENNLTDYITCIIQEEENSNSKEITANSLGILDTPYRKLLDQTKIYKINIISSNIDEIKKELLNYNLYNKKIDINSKSLERISKNLNKTKYDISDYISILVLYNDDNDYDKDIIKKKLIDKYDKIGQNVYFMGKKDFLMDFNIPLKNNKNGIHRINNLFNNVLNKIENIENNSFSDDNSEKNKNNNNNKKLNNSKKFYEINIKSEIYNNKNNENHNGAYQITDDIDEKGCQKEFCPNCHIF